MMRRETFHRLLRIVLPLFLLILGVYATVRGLRLRGDLFEWSAPIHHGDYYSGYSRGRIAYEHGILDTYDKIQRGEIDGERQGIDYAPLRLTAVGLWAKWFKETQPRMQWRGSYEDTRPMLLANTAAEWASSVLVFLLVRLWWVRSHGASEWRSTVACVVGFIGAMLCWFNPAVLWDAHCWPQWDVWLLPFFLGALFLACTDWWFAAGACVMVGAFLKGQILLVAPLFVLWPLFQLRWWQALMGVCGAVMMTAILASPWMLRGWTLAPDGHWGGILWVCLTVLAVALLPLAKSSSRKVSEWLFFVGFAALVTPVWWGTDASFTWKCLIALFAMGAVLSAHCSWRVRLPLSAALVGAAVLFLMPLYGASSAWFTIGFEYGTKKFTGLASAPGTYSLPQMLGAVFGWSDNMNTPLFRWPDVVRKLISPIYASEDASDYEVSIAQLTWSLYAACLVLCAAGAAINDRRRDSRFLIAFVAPWICFFSLLTQMNNRYMVWGAVLPALLVGTDIGLTLLGLLLSGIAVAGMSYHMMGPRSDFAPEISQYIYAIRSNLGWAVALIGAIFLYSAVVPRRRAKRVQPNAASTPSID